MLPKEHPAGMRHVVCIGSGGPSSCRWTSGHRAKLYSELQVFAWAPHADFSGQGMQNIEPGVVRSFTLATRARPGFYRVYHLYGDAYIGWPPDFYMAHVRVVGTHVAEARFNAVVARLAARFAQSAKTTHCAAR